MFSFFLLHSSLNVLGKCLSLVRGFVGNGQGLVFALGPLNAVVCHYILITCISGCGIFHSGLNAYIYPPQSYFTY